MQQFDVIIIGAGAAGLMCAGVAAQGGKSVLVLDHAEKPGKKILISGGGRCNFTNRFISAAAYISQNPHFCKSALARFTAADFISMVEKSAITHHERNHGQLFCDDSAQQIIDMLMQPCREHSVTVQLRSTITSVQKNDTFEVQSDKGLFRADSLVVATGGLSMPKMGATPFGLKLAKQFGLKTVPTVAGLAPFTFTGKEQEVLKSLAGISLDASVCCGNKVFKEAMLFTHRGLSGPAMLQISSYWQPGDELDIDLLPDCNIKIFLAEKRQSRPQARLSTLLSERLPKRLAQLLTETQFEDARMQELNEKQIEQIANQLHHWRLKPNGTEGYRTAEVTVGGVDTNELSSKTMESKKVPGLYFIGEVVDVTGHLGGFNFQWAWSSGYTAGLAVADMI
jgi:predicted Rossmann fold flavoprotein